MAEEKAPDGAQVPAPEPISSGLELEIAADLGDFDIEAYLAQAQADAK